MLHDARVDVVEDHVSQALVARLEAAIWSDPEKTLRQEWKHTDEVRHPSWKHALIADLPDEALYRRRFFGYLWDIDPAYKGRLRRRTLGFERRVIFPEMRNAYPESFGRVAYAVQTNPMFTEEFDV